MLSSNKKNKTKQEKLEKIGVEISRWEGEIIHLLWSWHVSHHQQNESHVSL